MTQACIVVVVVLLLLGPHYCVANDVVIETLSNGGLIRNGSVWFVKFHASWCGACKSIAGEWTILANEPSPAIESLNVHFASVDVDRNRALAETFGVKVNNHTCDL
jgi:thiol-disulfide isomerase/thioredoxin